MSDELNELTVTKAATGRLEALRAVSNLSLKINEIHEALLGSDIQRAERLMSEDLFHKAGSAVEYYLFLAGLAEPTG